MLAFCSRGLPFFSTSPWTSCSWLEEVAIIYKYGYNVVLCLLFHSNLGDRTVRGTVITAQEDLQLSLSFFHAVGTSVCSKACDMYDGRQVPSFQLPLCVSIFQIHPPFYTSTFQINMFAITLYPRSDDAMAHQRIVDNGRTQKNTYAEPWGCWCGWEYCQPDCAANLHRRHFYRSGVSWRGAATRTCGQTRRSG